MDERNKAIFGSILFLIFIIVIGIGGYFYTFRSETTSEKKMKELINQNKINKDKDYIYYENSIIVSEELQIIYEVPVINLNNKNAIEINTELSKDADTYNNSVKKISSTNDETGKEKIYETDDIYSATIRDYKQYEYGNYISLVATDYLFDCHEGIYDYTLIKSYVFDVEKNKLISSFDILTKYNISLSDVKEKIKAKLNKEQTTIDEVEVIKIEETLDNLENDATYAIYIDNNGNLNIKYIVKSNLINYNDNIVIKK